MLRRLFPILKKPALAALAFLKKAALAVLAFLKKALLWLLAILLVVADRWITRVLEPSVRPFLKFMGKLTKVIAIRLLGNDPTSLAAYDLAWDKLGQAFRTDYYILFSVLAVCLGVGFGFVVMPLLSRFLRRRRLQIFVSFNRTQEPIAEALQQSLQQGDLGASRLPYRAGASHQDIVEAVSDGIRRCDALICVPGADRSFVESEVMSATALDKAVVFLVSESTGTLPDTANKRHPMFKLEATKEQRFEPLIRFLHYIGADYRSQLDLYRRALAHPLMSIRVHLRLAVLLVGLGTWTLAFQSVSVYKAGQVRTESPEPGADGRSLAVITQAGLVSIVSIVVLVVSGYVVLVMRGMVRQWRTQRRASLKVATAEFARDDWIDSVPDLAKGSTMYQCMFEGSILAHHEASAPNRT